MAMINAGYAQAYSEIGGLAAAQPQEDSVSTCLKRILGMFPDMENMDAELAGLVDRLVGPRSASNQIKAGGSPNVPPAHILFLAHEIEQELKNHMTRLQGTGARLNQLL